MKRLYTILIFILVISSVKSQDTIFLKDDKIVNLTIGFGNALYSGILYSSIVPPVTISGEYEFMDEILEEGSIGIGGFLGYSAYKHERTYLADFYGYKVNNIFIGARGAFHYPFIEKLDTYTGLIIGALVVSKKEFGNFDPNFHDNISNSRLKGAWFAGGRYYFTDKLAGLIELGYGIAYFNFGIALKL